MKPLPEFMVVDAPGLEACCRDIAQQTQVAFDTEFVGEETYVPDLCLVQVATANALYLIDPLVCGSLESFWELLADPARTVIVHAGREEVRICRGAIGRPPANLFDVQIAAGLVGLGYPLGYGPLVYSVLRKRLVKGETLTDWRRRPLSQEQIRYAYDDVRDLLAVWKKIDSQLHKLQRREWAREEFSSFVTHALLNGAEVERWRKLKGISSLDSKRLAVVRELYLWRDEVAQRRNRPSRSVLRDDLLVEIARRSPRQESDISSLRGLGRADVTAILAAVSRARALPPDRWPSETEKDNDSHAVALVTSLLSVVLSDWCARNSLTTPLVATTADLRELVRNHARGEPLPADASLVTGWRKGQVLPMLLEILEGRRALRVRSLEGENPIEYGHARPRAEG